MDGPCYGTTAVTVFLHQIVRQLLIIYVPEGTNGYESNDELQANAVKYGARAILLKGFGTLVALIGILGFSAYRRADRIESEIAAIHDTHQQSVDVLNKVKRDILILGILIRDYLLDREREVMQLLAEGKSNKEVAAILDLSTYTVETHRTNLMHKLNLHNAAEIVLYAVRKKVIA